MGTIDVSAMTFGAALAEILTSVTTAPAIDVAAFAVASIADQAGLLRLAKQAIIRLRQRGQRAVPALRQARLNNFISAT